MGTLEQENAKLERLREYLSSDEHIRQEVAPWITATMEERMAAGEELCRLGDEMFARLEPAAQERALYRTPLPADSLEILARLR